MKKHRKDESGRFVLIMVLSFFGVVCAVDGLFVYLALRSYSGVVTEQPYEKGLAYNDTIEQAEQQNSLNLISRGDYRDGTLTVSLKTSQGIPVSGAKVRARIVRPVQDGYDFDVSMKEQGEGLYSATIKTPLPGIWIARTEASWDRQTYRMVTKFITP